MAMVIASSAVGQGTSREMLRKSARCVVGMTENCKNKKEKNKMVEHTIDKGVTSKGLTLYGGMTEKTRENGGTITFTRWFNSVKELEETHPEFMGAKQNDLGSLDF